MPRQVKKHIHMYWRPRGLEKYICRDPDCYHSMPKNALLGKRSICNECHEPFLLDGYALDKKAEPKCKKCRKTKATEITRKISAELTDIFSEMDEKPLEEIVRGSEEDKKDA